MFSGKLRPPGKLAIPKWRMLILAVGYESITPNLQRCGERVGG